MPNEFVPEIVKQGTINYPENISKILKKMNRTVNEQSEYSLWEKRCRWKPDSFWDKSRLIRGNNQMLENNLTSQKKEGRIIIEPFPLPW